MTPLLFSELTEPLIGAFYEVFRELRGGLLETPYRNAMMVALGERGIHAERERPLDIFFHDVVVGHYRMDIVVADRIVIECKTAKKIESTHEAQLLNYLHATRLPLGFILNFGESPTFKRMIYDVKNPARPWIDENW